MTQMPDRSVGAGSAEAEVAGAHAPTTNAVDNAVDTVVDERPSRDEVDAVMWAAQLFVAMSARSLAAVEAEVSLPQLRVLVILASQGPQSLNAVARSLNIHPSNATRACDKLVVAGLVRRGEDPEDRRQLALRLTAAGTELIEKVMQHRRDQVEDLLGRLPAHQRRALSAALRALATTSGDTLNQAAWQAGWITRHGGTTPRTASADQARRSLTGSPRRG